MVDKRITSTPAAIPSAINSASADSDVTNALRAIASERDLAPLDASNLLDTLPDNVQAFFSTDRAAVGWLNDPHLIAGTDAKGNRLLLRPGGSNQHSLGIYWAGDKMTPVAGWVQNPLGGRPGRIDVRPTAAAVDRSQAATLAPALEAAERAPNSFASPPEWAKDARHRRSEPSSGWNKP